MEAEWRHAQVLGRARHPRGLHAWPPAASGGSAHAEAVPAAAPPLPPPAAEPEQQPWRRRVRPRGEEPM
eukprot:8894934-Alexandrium_andersonii.AAC.1